MNFNSAGLVEEVIWRMRLADMPRGENRAQINRLANGNSPWTVAEADAAQIQTNVNWLEMPEMCADARRTYYNAFFKQGNFFKAACNYGNAVKRRKWGAIVTAEINRMMKRSRAYTETLKSQLAMCVLHGIGPVVWFDRERWCPRSVSLEDVLIPSDTRLSMENLSHFAVFRQYTPMELKKAALSPGSDPAWNKDVVKAAIEWAETETQKEITYADVMAPEKVEDRWSQDNGFYGTDAVPTVDAWDFYFWDDSGGQAGWRRRMVIDTPAEGVDAKSRLPSKNAIGDDHGKWLYNPDNSKVYCGSLENIIQFQIGDAAAVAPFKYHTTRSLGWLVYSVCHVNNRLRCKLTDAVFESMLQYFRTSNPDDHERIAKVDLQNYGVVPDGVSFVKAEERWKIDYNLVSMAFGQNRERLQAASTQFHEQRDLSSAQKEKTATQIMAEVNASSALVGGLLLQSFQYAEFMYSEIFRRCCIPNSVDPEVRTFRQCVIAKGVPEKALDASLWEITAERSMGNGNKTLEIAMADKLMAARALYDPESQRKVLHIYTQTNSDVPGLADELVPLDRLKVSDSTRDAQLMIGSILAGTQFEPATGQNPQEVIAVLLSALDLGVKKIQARGAPLGMDEIAGLMNLATHVRKYMLALAQDKEAAPRVKEFNGALTQLTKALREFAKAAQAQQQQPGQPGMDPAEAAKIQATIITAQTKSKLAAESHAQKTQQREVQFRMKMQQDEEKHKSDLKKKRQDAQVEVASADVKTAAEIKRANLQAAAAGAEAQPENEE